MSDFRFACPNCGQRIIVDSVHRGREINCPDCQKTLTIPQIRAPVPVAQAGERAALPPKDAKVSKLAVVSLVCSMALGLGCIPGIVFGHLARLRMRRDPALQGKGMANAGLIISYSFLLCTMSLLAYGLVVLAPPAGRQLKAAEKAANTPAVMAPRLVDHVEVGVRESEDAHGFKNYRSRSGAFPSTNIRWRDAASGGSFSYDLKVDPAKPMNLYCTYWGNEGPPGRHFDILVNDTVIAVQKLNFNDPGHYFDVEYKIPQKLTRGTNQVTVTFQAYPGKFAGGLFAIQVVRR